MDDRASGFWEEVDPQLKPKAKHTGEIVCWPTYHPQRYYMKKINLAEACRDNPISMTLSSQVIYCRELVDRYQHAENEKGGMKRQAARIFFNLTGVAMEEFIEVGEWKEYNNA